MIDSSISEGKITEKKYINTHHENYFVEKEDDIRNIIEKTCKNLSKFDRAIRALYVMEENNLLDPKIEPGQGLIIPCDFPSTNEIINMPKIKKFRLKMMELLE